MRKNWRNVGGVIGKKNNVEKTWVNKFGWKFVNKILVENFRWKPLVRKCHIWYPWTLLKDIAYIESLYLSLSFSLSLYLCMVLSWSSSSPDEKLSENIWFAWSNFYTLKRHTVEKVGCHNGEITDGRKCEDINLFWVSRFVKFLAYSSVSSS